MIQLRKSNLKGKYEMLLDDEDLMILKEFYSSVSKKGLESNEKNTISFAQYAFNCYKEICEVF